MSAVVFDGANDDEMLRRQIHPNHFKPGSRTELERTAFTPRWAKDEPDGRMSHLRGHVSGEEAWRRFTDGGHTSAGTWTTCVGFARDLGLPCGDDSGPSRVSRRPRLRRDDQDSRMARPRPRARSRRLAARPRVHGPPERPVAPPTRPAIGCARPQSPGLPTLPFQEAPGVRLTSRWMPGASRRARGSRTQLRPGTRPPRS